MKHNLKFLFASLFRRQIVVMDWWRMNGLCLCFIFETPKQKLFLGIFVGNKLSMGKTENKTPDGVYMENNRPFPSSPQPPFQSEGKCEVKSSLLWKSVFIHIEIRTNYHNKKFALRLALKERMRWTRKWPITDPHEILLFSLGIKDVRAKIFLRWDFLHFSPRVSL